MRRRCSSIESSSLRPSYAPFWQAQTLPSQGRRPQIACGGHDEEFCGGGVIVSRLWHWYGVKRVWNWEDDSQSGLVMTESSGTGPPYCGKKCAMMLGASAVLFCGENDKY